MWPSNNNIWPKKIYLKILVNIVQIKVKEEEEEEESMLSIIHFDYLYQFAKTTFNVCFKCNIILITNLNVIKLIISL